MKKELLAGTKGLVTTLMVAMVVVCIFQLFSAIGNFANRTITCFLILFLSLQLSHGYYIDIP